MNPEQRAAAEIARRKANAVGFRRSIIAVDPGTSATGIAALIDGNLVDLHVVCLKGGSAKDRLPAMCNEIAHRLETLIHWVKPDTLAVEWQMIRPNDPRPNDILNMAIVIGAVLAVSRPATCKLLAPLPVQWKGSIKSDVFLARVRELEVGQAALDKMVTVPEKDQHNGLDATALATWAINQRMPWAL